MKNSSVFLSTTITKILFDRTSGEIVAYVWEKRNLKTAKALRKSYWNQMLHT